MLIIICCNGDFNLPDIDWDSDSIHSHRCPLEINDLMLNMPAECGFTQVVNFLTRERILWTYSLLLIHLAFSSVNQSVGLVIMI